MCNLYSNAYYITGIKYKRVTIMGSVSIQSGLLASAIFTGRINLSLTGRVNLSGIIDVCTFHLYATSQKVFR